MTTNDKKKCQKKTKTVKNIWKNAKKGKSKIQKMTKMENL